MTGAYRWGWGDGARAVALWGWAEAGSIGAVSWGRPYCVVHRPGSAVVAETPFGASTADPARPVPRSACSPAFIPGVYLGVAWPKAQATGGAYKAVMKSTAGRVAVPGNGAAVVHRAPGELPARVDVSRRGPLASRTGSCPKTAKG